MTNPGAPQEHAEAILALVQASMNDLNDNYPEDFELRLSIDIAIRAAGEEAAALR